MILRTEKLLKKYKHRMVVNGISINVEQGEIVGLFGPNGAGKTTTFHMIVGLVRPHDGDVYLGDNKITYYPMYQRSRIGIGYLTQEPSIFRGLSVEDNLMAVAQMLVVSKSKQQERVDSLLEDFGLTRLKKQMSVTLSGGEKRRLEIARSLITSPKILLLDEPFVGIDPVTVDDIQKVIISLRDMGLGILITDHNIRETLEIIDRAYVVYEGKILFEGNAKELLRNPDVKKMYLGSSFNT